MGKSNVFDAVLFLGLLARKPLAEAAASVRNIVGRRGDASGLFRKRSDGGVEPMRLAATVLVAPRGRDELMQEVEASSTLLRYQLDLRLRDEATESGPIEILGESLEQINKGKAAAAIAFPHSASVWREPLVVSKRRSPNGFLRTEVDADGRRTIWIGQDGNAGRPQQRLAEPLPRTVLSTVNAANSPTGVLAQSEMSSWSVLQFEPTALRSPDGFHDPSRIGPDGAHVPATLHRLLHAAGDREHREAVRQRIINRLRGLVQTVERLDVDRDEKRELLTLMGTMRDGTAFSARALSDGTLRFLALAVLEEASQDGVFCLEEPENGVFPDQIPRMIELLQDIALDPNEAPGDDNPLRQVIINIHSPSVVAQIPDSALILAQAVDPMLTQADPAVGDVRFLGLSDTWRTKRGGPTMRRADLAAYLDPLGHAPDARDFAPAGAKPIRRVRDREDLQQMYLFSGGGASESGGPA